MSNIVQKTRLFGRRLVDKTASTQGVRVSAIRWVGKNFKDSVKVAAVVDGKWVDLSPTT